MHAPAGPLTVQVNVADPVAPVPSVAVTVTVNVPPAVGVPEISPVEELTDRPVGSPAAGRPAARAHHPGHRAGHPRLGLTVPMITSS